MDVQITQFNVQLYFRKPVLDNSDALNRAFDAAEGFSSGKPAGDRSGSHPMQDTKSFYMEGFRIAPVQSNVLPFRILQVMSYPNVLKKPNAETVSCLHYVAASLKQHLNIDIENDIYAVRVVFHSIVTGRSDIHHVLSKLGRLDGIPSISGKYAGHKNPMDAIQLTSITDGSLSQEFWSDIRVSQFNTNSYVVTIFNETHSLALDFIKDSGQFAGTLIQEMESAAEKQS